jgi:curved DNA-binding protein CbpA
LCCAQYFCSLLLLFICAFIAATLPPTAESEIRSQYRKLALKNHPDKHNNSDAAKRHFQLIGEAARVLSDPTLRAQYNASARWNIDCFSVVRSTFVPSSSLFCNPLSPKTERLTRSAP